MATATEQQVLTLEKQYWDAMQKRDVPTVMALTADPCLVVNADGAAPIANSQFAEMLKSDDWQVRSFKLDEANASFHQISDDVAVVAYRVHEELDRFGKPETLDAYDSSVWVRKNGTWLCAVHTETPATAAAR